MQVDLVATGVVRLSSAPVGIRKGFAGDPLPAGGGVGPWNAESAQPRLSVENVDEPVRDQDILFRGARDRGQVTLPSHVAARLGIRAGLLPTPGRVVLVLDVAVDVVVVAAGHRGVHRGGGRCGGKRQRRNRKRGVDRVHVHRASSCARVERARRWMGAVAEAAAIRVPIGRGWVASPPRRPWKARPGVRLEAGAGAGANLCRTAHCQFLRHSVATWSSAWPAFRNPPRGHPWRPPDERPAAA